MEERKWEDMNVDCLVNIFGRLELQTRLQAVPLVCKTWYKALLNPSCWEHLIFPQMIPRLTSQTELMKFVVNRSQRRATILVLPYSCNREELLYVSEECWCCHHVIPSLIIKWKNLEALKLGNPIFINDILEPIPIALLDLRNCSVGGEAAAAIVSHFPKLKRLIMNESIVNKEDLLLIMQGCKQLDHLHVRNCSGFDEGDEDILRLSSGIKHFMSDGSKEMSGTRTPGGLALRLPRLKLLALSPRVCAEHRDIIPSLLIKWKNLEGLKLGDLTFVDQILEPIPIHLP
ncbi:F-box protein FBW2 [Daucus carota subsp. sativus]|uniref:F-box protein FBW2 n=1 Tax=Daucus carota subsp. sativus TaxID=79200 RepID=UPI0007EFD4A3|nr:PREDICTED: F-box protein FBW2-like [Daucus carota subsp. sativus]